MTKRSAWAQGKLVSVTAYVTEDAARTAKANISNRSSTLFPQVFCRSVKAGRASINVWVLVVRQYQNAELTDEDRAVRAEEDRIEDGQARWSETGSTKR